MRKNILNYVNKLQAYKTAIKNLHWSSKKMSEHKLLDEIADSLADNQDEIAEIAQGIFGKIKKNELKPRRYQITNSLKMLKDLTKDTKDFCEELKGKELTGLRSVVESFIGELNKFDYLMDMCIKEDIKRNLKNIIENKKNKKKLTESNLYSIIENSVKKTIKESLEGNSFIFDMKLDGAVIDEIEREHDCRLVDFNIIEDGDVQGEDYHEGYRIEFKNDIIGKIWNELGTYYGVVTNFDNNEAKFTGKDFNEAVNNMLYAMIRG